MHLSRKFEELTQHREEHLGSQKEYLVYHQIRDEICKAIWDQLRDPLWLPLSVQLLYRYGSSHD